MKADTIHYLDNILDELGKQWPNHRIINIVFHGHSVPAGFFATPYVNSLEAYPAVTHRIIKERFPFAIVNCIVTAKGGENSISGAARFQDDVLCHKPDLVTIDYGINDRGPGLEKAEPAWRQMIEAGLAKNVKVILLTPSWDRTYFARDEDWKKLEAHAEQIRHLASEYQVGLCDTFAVYRKNVSSDGDLVGLLSHVNHPSAKAHRLIAETLGEFFLPR